MVNGLVIGLALTGFFLAILLCFGLKYVQKREAYAHQVYAQREQEKQMEEGKIIHKKQTMEDEEDEEDLFHKANSNSIIHTNFQNESTGNSKRADPQFSDPTDIQDHPFIVEMRDSSTTNINTNTNTNTKRGQHDIQTDTSSIPSNSILKRNSSEKKSQTEGALPSSSSAAGVVTASAFTDDLMTPTLDHKANVQWFGGKHNDAFTPRSWRSSQHSSDGDSLGFGWTANSAESSSNTCTTATTSSHKNITSDDRRNIRNQEDEFLNQPHNANNNNNNNNNNNKNTLLVTKNDTSSSTGIGTNTSKTSGDSSGAQTSSAGGRPALERKMSVDRSSGRMMIRFDSTPSMPEPILLQKINNSSNANSKQESTKNIIHTSNDDNNSTFVKQQDANSNKQVGWTKFKTFFSNKGGAENPEQETVDALATQKEESYPWHYLVTDSQSIAGSVGKYSNSKIAMQKVIEEDNKAREQKREDNINKKSNSRRSSISEFQDSQGMSDKEWFEKMAQLPFKFDPTEESTYSNTSDGVYDKSKVMAKESIQNRRQSGDNSSPGFFVIKKDNTTQIYNFDLESDNMSDQASSKTPQALYQIETLISAVDDDDDTNSQVLRKESEIAEVNRYIGQLHSAMASSNQAKLQECGSSTSASEPMSNPNAPRCNSILSVSSTKSSEDSVMMLAADRRKQLESENQLLLKTNDQSILASTATNDETILDEPNSEEWEEEARERMMRARAIITPIDSS